jgi:hypothetical protein
MASDVMSLFGMDPNTIQQDRTNKAVSQASAMNPYFAVGAAGGSLMGQGINSAFGLQTADMAQAQGIQDSMDGFDLSTPQGMQQAAQQLMMNGNYAESMALHAKARSMLTSELDASNAAEDRALGEYRDITVGMTTPTIENGMKSVPIKHSVTFLPSGEVEDATQGITFKSRSEWMDSLKNIDDIAEEGGDTDGESNAAQLLKDALEEGKIPNNSKLTAEEILETNITPEIQAGLNNQSDQEILEVIGHYQQVLSTISLPRNHPTVIKILQHIENEKAKLSTAPK